MAPRPSPAAHAGVGAWNAGYGLGVEFRHSPESSLRIASSLQARQVLRASPEKKSNKNSLYRPSQVKGMSGQGHARSGGMSGQALYRHARSKACQVGSGWEAFWRVCTGGGELPAGRLSRRWGGAGPPPPPNGCTCVHTPPGIGKHTRIPQKPVESLCLDGCLKTHFFYSLTVFGFFLLIHGWAQICPCGMCTRWVSGNSIQQQPLLRPQKPHAP